MEHRPGLAGGGCSTGFPSSASETRRATTGGPSRRLRARGADRRPHRLGAERRLARRQPQRRRGCEVLRRIAGRARRPSPSGWSTGRTKRERASAAACSAPRRPQARWPTRTSCASLTDPTGSRLPSALAACGVDLEQVLDAQAQLTLPPPTWSSTSSRDRCSRRWASRSGAVLGTYGVERWRITWTGQAAHAGSTPMDKRRDALAGAAKLALELADIAASVGHGAVCTSGASSAGRES